MFDLITGTQERPLRERSVPSKIVAIVAHGILITVLLVVPLLLATDQMPEVPTMLAFVSAPPAPPPPPPPPAPPAPARPAKAAAEPVKTSGQFVAPIAAPSSVAPEHFTPTDDTGGVPGGVEGGIVGGVVGGIVGGLVSPAPPPPPPPPPPAPAPKGPVRIGGQITAPALLHRVEPEYPEVAALAHVTGVVILEAVVDTGGAVTSVKVLRGRHKLLDAASERALMQWRYTPLVLNGIPTPFVLTVTFNFSVGS